jgi:HEAT repeat protein
MALDIRAICILALAPLEPLVAQSLAQRVAAAPDGKVEITFASRPGVCGDGKGVIGDGRHFMMMHGNSFSMSDSDDEDDYFGDCPCTRGPVRVSMRVRGHKVEDLNTYAGPLPTPGRTGVTDLGAVDVKTATNYLLSIARTVGGDIGHDAIFPATLADSVEIWPELLKIARDESVASDTRESAVFWVSQAAGDAATRGLDSLVSDEKGDRDIREHAVFALSQRPKDEGVPILIRIAKTNKDPEIRRKALFWLGQSEDPRALALFEEILTKR